MLATRVTGERFVPSTEEIHFDSATSIGIRRFRADDAEAMWAAVTESVNELCEWMVWCKADYSIEDSAAFVARCASDWEVSTSYSFVIFDREDDSFLGSIGLNRIDHAHKLANLGYWVRTRKTRRGIASAGIGLVSRFAFNHLRLHRLEMIIPVENYASLRVAEKSGATREGLLRKRVILDGTPRDAFIYSLVSEDLARR
jgi:RimJ/RimL family protein N-acetyltransferase